jgi:hypothetical protein
MEKYVEASKIFRPDIQKLRQIKNAASGVWYCLKGIELLVHRCEECVEIKGEHIEIQQSCFT